MSRWRDAEDVIRPLRDTNREPRDHNSGCRPPADLGDGPVSADRAQQAPQEGSISLPLGRLAGEAAVTKRPSPSNTTIG